MTDLTIDQPQPQINPLNPPTRADAHGLTPLEPAYIRAVRIMMMLNAAPLIIGAAALDYFVLRELTAGIPILSIVVLILAIWAILAVPPRRFAALGYDLGADQLRIARGVMWHVDTIVPFVRVQHIDVSRGPIERMVGTATLTVHTAGNHNSVVSLPGLHPDSATMLRDRIRAEIQTDFA